MEKSHLNNYYLIYYLNSTEDFYPSDDDPNYNKIVEELETESHSIKIETWKSINGGFVIKRTTSKSKLNISSLEVKELESILKNCIEREDYEQAAIIRDEINKKSSKGED